MNELRQKPVWRPLGPYLVSSELFLDLVFTNACDCACPWCIARTRDRAVPDRAAWDRAVRDAFRLFDVRSAIILGGEATVDPDFFGKLDDLARVLEAHPVENLILTTNGSGLRDPAFVDRLARSPVTAVNLSRMHYDQQRNDAAFGAPTITAEEIASAREKLRGAGCTLRLNANVWRGNLDSPDEMTRYVQQLGGLCDAVKFSPLMETTMFGTVDAVTACTRALAIPEEEIRTLFDAFAARHTVLDTAANVLGFVDYAEADVHGCRVILKYQQVEDKYDRDRVIPTLKIYPNGCLSNEWSFRKDVRSRLGIEA